MADQLGHGGVGGEVFFGGVGHRRHHNEYEALKQATVMFDSPSCAHYYRHREPHPGATYRHPGITGDPTGQDHCERCGPSKHRVVAPAN